MYAVGTVVNTEQRSRLSGVLVNECETTTLLRGGLAFFHRAQTERKSC